MSYPPYPVAYSATGYGTMSGVFSMAKKCPNCGSDRINKRHYGKKAGGMIGAAAGASTGMAGAAGGAELGASLGMAAGPVGAAAGAILGGLFGAVAGGTVGTKAGEFVDDKILDNYQCLSCGHAFNKRRKS